MQSAPASRVARRGSQSWHVNPDWSDNQKHSSPPCLGPGRVSGCAVQWFEPLDGNSRKGWEEWKAQCSQVSREPISSINSSHHRLLFVCHAAGCWCVSPVSSSPGTHLLLTRMDQLNDVYVWRGGVPRTPLCGPEDLGRGPRRRTSGVTYCSAHRPQLHKLAPKHIFFF